MIFFRIRFFIMPEENLKMKIQKNFKKIALIILKHQFYFIRIRIDFVFFSSKYIYIYISH